MAYSGVFVFGDSLVDAGNALKLAQWYGGLPFSDLPEGAPTSDQGYFQGRFTDGYTFADLIANKAIGTATKPIFPYAFEDPWIGVRVSPFTSDPSGHNLNFAYGGSQIRQGSEVVPDFDGQTDAFKDAVDNHADPNALYVVTMGGNDVRSLAPTGSDPVPVDQAHSALDAAADKMLHELGQLIDIGVHNILITGVPDVGLIPKYDSNGNGVLDGAEIARSAAATEYSQYLDALIRTQVIPALEAQGAKVTYAPLMDYQEGSASVTGGLNSILPTLAALYGLTADELSNNLLQHEDLVFFDGVHPTAQVHALFGAYSYSLLTGLPWIETLPLTGAEVDYGSVASIGAAGETDKLVVSLVAGTTYTVEMLGISSLGTAGSLADPTLRLLGPSGAIAGTNDDSGAGFDATLTFTAATTGNYTIELSAVGSLTGSYAFQAAVLSGAATLAGNTYTVNNATTIVLEGAGGIGTDVVKASVNYALSAGGEIEVLRTTNDKGKSDINLTGNDFDQAIVGNGGKNVIEGKSGADVMTGGGGSDTFVLSNAALLHPGGANVDTITDYARGEVVDVSQILSVAAGTNVSTGGYLRVTTSGLIQVDVDGGGNNWVTLSTVNGNSAVTLRYLSGGSATSVSLSRVADTLAANSNAVLVGAVAAAGLVATPAAAHAPSADSDGIALSSHLPVAVGEMLPFAGQIEGRLALSGESHAQIEQAVFATMPALAINGMGESGSGSHLAVAQAGAPSELLHGTAAPVLHDSAVAASVMMPSADMLSGPVQAIDGAKANAEVARVLVDVLQSGGAAQTVDSLLHSLPGQAPDSPLGAAADHATFAATLGLAPALAMFEAMPIHQDAAPIA
jgi:phospholipase/lecithinase/hemolysin